MYVSVKTEEQGRATCVCLADGGPMCQRRMQLQKAGPVCVTSGPSSSLSFFFLFFSFFVFNSYFKFKLVLQLYVQMQQYKNINMDCIFIIIYLFNY